ncbi:hypothetical protein [Zoogloea sp.]|uniref:hypothetical protein n=1 Tax=Zoogloea sp. TaxID=49181 RepID=UPI001415C001|nr:MAG: hypothetical protein F9K15_08665 [Zoogloea sp.]
MPRRHYVLYLNSAGLTPCEIGRGLSNIGQPCPPTREGFARFETFLQSAPPGRRMTLLADLPDEAHHLESLPFIRGRDRHNMLERRRRHLFGETPFSLTRTLGRSPEGRRDEQVLFAALPRPKVITPWLEHIVQAGHVLAGIISVPFLTRHLLPADFTGPALLAHATPAGFRVSCFQKGLPRFSRLTALASVSGPSGQTWQDELRRSADYLINQRILPRDTPTPVLLIDHEALDLPRDADLGTLHPGLAIRLEAPASTATGEADSPLHGLLELLSHHPGQPQFAPGAMLAPYRRLLLVQAIQVLAVACTLVCGGLSMHHLGAIRDLRQQEEAILAQSRALEARASLLRGALHTRPQGLAHLESDLAALEAMQRAPQGPEADLRRLADTLTGNPGIQLEALDWQHLLPTAEARTARQASRSLEIRLAPPAQAPQDDVQPAALIGLLRALRQWPGTEILRAPERMEPGLPAPQEGDATTGSRAPSDHPTIQVRWLLPQ